MFDAISSHGGIVTLMAADGLMAVFGAPLPQPDPCDSAVRTALEMIETIDLFNLERDAAGKPQIKIGIGIASGEMVAGYAGTNERAAYTCIGDTVNLAIAPRIAHQGCRTADPHRQRDQHRGGAIASRRSRSGRCRSGQGKPVDVLFGRACAKP